jgi:hypothetical protein
MARNNKLKAYVRYDGNGRIISGSLILQRFKPAVGNWKEIDANECCNFVLEDLLLLEDGGDLLQEDGGNILL